MSMIRVEHLSFSYGSSWDPIFEDVSFTLDTDWRLGFVGRNGRGKTTFLNLLLGKYEYSGQIVSSVEFDYFPYPVKNPERSAGAILSEICPAAQEWELERELSCLQVAPEVLERPFRTLSNGEQTKALLAALFLNEGRFLLIDEPTNHLDLRARETVAAYLSRKKGFILVSHDRSVLDACVDHILALNRTDIEVQSGNFSSWMENFQRRQEFEEAQDQRLRQDIRRLESAARRTSVWSDRVEASKSGAADRGYVGHKSAKMMKRSKTIEARQKAAVQEKSALLRNAEREEKLKICPLEYHSQVLARFEEAAPMYEPGNPVCQPVSFELRQGERVVLDGRNGSGKSSLLKLLTGEKIPHTGRVPPASGLVISYVSQDTSRLKGTLTEYAQGKGIDESTFKTLLRKLGFERVQFEKPIEEYSGGQKKKVLIAGSLCEQAHLYIWDEPLNFIDIYSRRQIEALLLEYAPSMLLVEHDSSFRSQISTRTISLFPPL